MLIFGAQGFAKEVLEILYQNKYAKEIAFYDDINNDIGGKLYKQFKIIRSEAEAKDFFNKNGTFYTIGIGDPNLRKEIYKKFSALGGVMYSTISTESSIGSFETYIGIGCNILPGVRISNNVSIGKGCIIYYNSIIAHDTTIGDFVEVSPSANILGRVKVSNYTHIGANATILPDITIGKNSKIGAGSVVTKDIPDNVLVVGTPAKIIKSI